MGSPKIRQVDPADTYEKNLNIQLEKAPELYAAESSQDYGRPAYAQLDLQVLRDVLTGTGDQPGLLELYSNEIMPKLSEAESKGASIQREADIADVERLGNRAREAFRSSNPEQAAILDELNQQALSDLQAGPGLPPDLAREIEQSVRAGQSARGMGFSMADVGNEALIKGLQAEHLQRRRQQFATQMVGVNNASGNDPFLQILGRSSVNIGQGGMVAGQGQSFNPGDVFNPADPTLTGLAVGNANAYNSGQIAKANNRAGILGGILGIGGNVGRGWASTW